MVHAETRSSFGPEQADSMGHSSDMATLAKDPPEGVKPRYYGRDDVPACMPFGEDGVHPVAEAGTE